MKGKFGIILVTLHKKQGQGEEVWTVDYCSLLIEISAYSLVLLWSSQHSKQTLLTRGGFPPSYLSVFPSHSENKGIPYSEQRLWVTVPLLPWPGCLSPLTEFLPQRPLGWCANTQARSGLRAFALALPGSSFPKYVFTQRLQCL